MSHVRPVFSETDLELRMFSALQVGVMRVKKHKEVFQLWHLWADTLTTLLPHTQTQTLHSRSSAQAVQLYSTRWRCWSGAQTKYSVRWNDARGRGWTKIVLKILQKVLTHNVDTVGFQNIPLRSSLKEAGWCNSRFLSLAFNENILYRR